jgi:hypothetical protein
MGPAATRTLRGALAGAAAAGVWAAQQPLDKQVFGSDYDDVELLGKWVTRERTWPAAGLALHLQNGATFGAAYAVLAPVLPLPPVLRGPVAGLLEHLATWPLARIVDRIHPARGDLPTLAGNGPAFWVSLWRHVLFGLVLGELERRLNAVPEPPHVDVEAVMSSNGHGSLEDAVLAHPSDQPG